MPKPSSRPATEPWLPVRAPGSSPTSTARSMAGPSAPWTCPVSASARTSGGWRTWRRIGELGQYGAASFGGRAWTRTPGDGWAIADAQSVREETLDLQAVRTALARRSRATSEDRGIEVIEGARTRRCRVAVDGATFRAAFPQIRWLVGDADIERWRGQLDYWVFADGQLGQVAGSVNGEAGAIRSEAIQATIEVLLTATGRGDELVIYPPAP